MKWLQELLDEAEKSQADLAKHLGIPAPRVSEMINRPDKRKLQPDEIKPTAEFFKISPDHLLSLIDKERGALDGALTAMRAGGITPAGSGKDYSAQRKHQGRHEHETPIIHYVGAGDEVHLISDAGTETAIDYTASPPGFERDKGAAVIVRGESMRPIYDPGDMLFFRHRRRPPATPKELPIRPVIVQVAGGTLYVKKLLPGTKKGRFHLLSINPLTPPLQDQPVESFAYIEWVKPRAM